MRAALDAVPASAREAPLLVGCSGGADSLALTLAAAAVRGAAAVQAAVVDHRLQEGSAERADATVALLAERGIAARVYPVDVTGPGGTEAAARRARRTALRAARPHPDSPILLGHTLDDQAETVLLGLGRGSGARSLAGMRPWDPPWLRPLLTVRRAVTRAACAELGLPVWEDPHNTDPRFTRARLRHEVLPVLEDVLAGGVAEALARTAGQLRDDVDALDAVAARLLADALRPADHTQAGHNATGADPTPTAAVPDRPRGNPGRGPGIGRPSVEVDRRGGTGPGELDARADGPPAAGPTGEPDAAADGLPDPRADGVDTEADGVPHDRGATATELDLATLRLAPPAVRRRVLRAWLAAAGVTGLTDAHLRGADVLAGRGPDRAGVAVPGGLELVRAHGRLGIRPVRWPSAR